MKKLFSLVLVLVAAMALNAKQVVFDFTKPADLGIVPETTASKGVALPAEGITINGVVMTSEKVQRNDNVLFTKSDGASYELRTYNTNKITFTADDNITAIEFSGSALMYAELTGKTWLAEGDVKEVTFTGTGTSKITSITLTVGEAPHVWVPDTVTVSKALELQAAGDDKDHFVKGVVKCQPFVTYDDFNGKASFWMNDIENENDTIEFYDGLGKDNAKWESLEDAWAELRVGDTILVYAGGISSYTNSKSGITFIEITGGYYAEKLGANPNPPDIVDPDTADIPELPYGVLSCADAVKAAEAIADPTADNKTVEGEAIKVRGFVTFAYDANGGKQSAWIGDKKGSKNSVLQGAYLQVTEPVAVGDYVELHGTLAKYYKAGKNGKADEIIVEVIDGTMGLVGATEDEIPELPEGVVSCADAKKAAEAIADPTADNKTVEGEAIKVRGFVTFAYDANSGKQSAWLSDIKGSSAGVIQGAYLQVTEPVEKGDYVELDGTLAKFFKAGKNGKADEIVIEVINGTMKKVGSQGIENVVLTEEAQKVIVDGVIYIIRDGKAYNVMGARVR